MDELGFVKGSMVVFIEGSPAINVTSMTKQNGTNSNTAGNTVQSAQKKVIIMQ